MLGRLTWLECRLWLAVAGITRFYPDHDGDDCDDCGDWGCCDDCDDGDDGDDGAGAGVDDNNDDNGDSVLSATHPDFTF